MIQALITEGDNGQTCLDRNDTSDLLLEMNQIFYHKQNTLGQGKLIISDQDSFFCSSKKRSHSGKCKVHSKVLIFHIFMFEKT